jgi:tetratricopeptide (TPR) repeat protein
LYNFQYIYFLLGLLAIPVFLLLFIYVIRWKKNTIKKIGDEKLVRQMIKNYSAKRFAIKFICIVFAFAACVLAVANLRTPLGAEKISRNGIDVMIALDVSKSMLAQDIKPNRLDRAKQLLSKLIDKLDNDRIGIVVFAGKAYLQMPLTTDHSAAKMYLSTATTDVVPTQGTVIGEALKMCFNGFNAKQKKYKAVILISDGEDHDEAATAIAAKMADEGISINTIGIGSPDGTTLVDAETNQIKKDKEGNIVVSKLNETALKEIASKGNGTYNLYTSADEVISNLSKQLSSMDQRSVTEESLVSYKSFFQYFVLLGLLFLIIEIFIREKKSAAKLSVVITIIFLSTTTSSFSQNEKATLKKGNELYNKNDFENAATEYQKITNTKPSNTTAQFNLGNALYKNSKTDAALNAYDNVITSTVNNTEKSKAYYNKGVVLHNNKKLIEAIEAYKNALKLNPADDDARQNLQQALIQQKQQKEKEQKKNKEKKKPKEDQNKKEQEKPKDEQKNDLPKPQPSKITKKDAEEKLKALLQQEKNLQDKLRKVNIATPNKPEKDW